MKFENWTNLTEGEGGTNTRKIPFLYTTDSNTNHSRTSLCSNQRIFHDEKLLFSSLSSLYVGLGRE